MAGFLIATGYPKALHELAGFIGESSLPEFVQCFLYDQLYPDSDVCGMDVPLEACPKVHPFLQVKVFHSAVATYHVPSDLSGIGGMYREWIRAAPSWKNGTSHYDCVFIENEPDMDGFGGMYVAQVKLFISFTVEDGKGVEVDYSCALVEWFSTYGDSPCEDTGLWHVVPDCDARGRRTTTLVHTETILRAAHVIGVAGHDRIPKTLTYDHSLDAFRCFYVNKYIDYHAHEIAW